MEEQNRKILISFDNLISEIKDTIEYKTYKDLKSKLKDNEEVNSLTNEIKILQRKSVKSKNKEDAKKIDDEIETKLKILENIPLYNEYLYAVKDLNYIINYIKEQIEYIVNENI